MFSYYFKLGLRSLRRNPALTALMVLTLAVGVAASISTLTILHVMSGDPIPHKSDRLFVPVMDVGRPDDYSPGQRPDDPQMTYTDARNLLNSGLGERRTAIYGVGAAVEAPRKDLSPVAAQGLAATRDAFSMFDAPFLHGQPWSEADDTSGTKVVVLSRSLSEKMFGDANPVGQRLRMMDGEFQVVGVLDNWLPVPRYYRLIGGPGAFGLEDDYWIPFQTAINGKNRNQGSTNCSGDVDAGFQAFIDSDCTWIQFWFEAKSSSGRAEIEDYIKAYSAEQLKLGRMKRNAPTHVYNVMEWLEYNKVVGNDSKLSAWLAFAFLLLCLVNAVGLLLAKFSVRASEVGIRRALGASRREIFRQFLIETAVVGLAGGVLGLALAFGALSLIAMQSKQMAVIAQMDWVMLIFTFVLSVVAAMIAGLLPTWRACQITPAIQLKSQ
ncbi:ABC transporter permease [Massilia sp. PAMC28688]|uniref:ABC transporter permease n=1 Tax=Massilia sp. PAMC28688 TaxID=2861283 RepID=UPI001C6284CD|nr:ABC transporter permease [Massilia sp. PAMC28688]QYF94872.1 ABC transporter permease [Massilia sp. PAMC28688]